MLRFVVLALLGCAAVVAALLHVRRSETSGQAAPEAAPEAVEDQLESEFVDEPRVPKAIWLVRGGVTLRGGPDDSARRLSSVVAISPTKLSEVTIPRFRGTDTAWKQLVACVQAQYARFDVLVTDQEPVGLEAGYVLVAVGGKPALLGHPARTAGLAPLIPGIFIEDPVVFVFSDTLRNNVQLMCEAAAMEAAHAYGLDHELLCKDTMSHLGGCGRKSFQDKDAPCGEHKARVCADRRATQNSVAVLRAVLGEKPPSR